MAVTCVGYSYYSTPDRHCVILLKTFTKPTHALGKETRNQKFVHCVNERANTSELYGDNRAIGTQADELVQTIIQDVILTGNDSPFDMTNPEEVENRTTYVFMSVFRQSAKGYQKSCCSHLGVALTR